MSTNEIDERTQFNEKIVLRPGPNTEYSAIDLETKEGKLLGRIVAHEWSNPKTNEDGTQRQDRHDHFTIYVSNDKGGLSHGLDIIVNQDKPQIQLHGDTVWKTKGARPVLQTKDGRFYTLEVEEWYETDEHNNAVLNSKLVHKPFDRDAVHWGKTTSRPYPVE